MNITILQQEDPITNEYRIGDDKSKHAPIYAIRTILYAIVTVWLKFFKDKDIDIDKLLKLHYDKNKNSIDFIKTLLNQYKKSSIEDIAKSADLAAVSAYLAAETIAKCDTTKNSSTATSSDNCNVVYPENVACAAAKSAKATVDAFSDASAEYSADKQYAKFAASVTAANLAYCLSFSAAYFASIDTYTDVYTTSAVYKFATKDFDTKVESETEYAYSDVKSLPETVLFYLINAYIFLSLKT